ncbi:MAG: hypothetical protein OXH99_01675 [Bryobacterales bacterium]|nr:hypothetical protein [Bryobacterales bacterium]
MADSDQAVEETLLSKYAECMEEIKKRTQVVGGFLTRECNAMYVQTTAESVALQIRKILELIALASLVANRSEYAKLRKSFRTDWNAKAIFKTLRKANPRFYPTPNKQVVDRDTGNVNSLENIKSGFLTEEDYLSLFDICSDVLHAENPFSAGRNAIDFLKDVPAWMEKIRRLLNHHTIQLTDDDRQLWVLMKAKSDGNVHVWEFKRVLGGGLSGQGNLRRDNPK